MSEPAAYMIWSLEHSLWWGPHRRGYTISIAEAGLYSHAVALNICARAIPGASTRIGGALPDLPVRQDDINAMVLIYRSHYPDRTEPWE